MKHIELAGRRFGLLVVLSFAAKRGRHVIYWACQCVTEGQPMTAFNLDKPLSTELTELIGRLGLLIVSGGGMTEEEVADLRGWLQAARSKHHAELREARGHRWTAAVLAFDDERFKNAVSVMHGSYEQIGEAES